MNGFFREKIRFINYKKGDCSSSIYFLPKKTKINKGFVLLFSLLVSSVILTAGLAVSRIIVRQIYLASVQRDSQMALFAADTGIECGRYWRSNSLVPNKKCNDQPLNKYRDNVGEPVGDLNNETNFWFNIGTQPDYQTCVRVDVTAQSILAKGYNVPCNNGQPLGGRIVERSLEHIYDTDF